MNQQANPELEKKASGDLGFFDRFAEGASNFASRAPFFAFCVLLIIVWSPSIFVLKFDVSQLLINTATTIITFLLVALIQNSEKRFENSMNYKLNAIADALADLIEAQADASTSNVLAGEMRHDAASLRRTLGIEQNISA